MLHALPGTEAAPSATTSPAVSEEKEINGYNAVVCQITVDGQRLDTLLSKGSFVCVSQEHQKQYAGTFGAKRPYRMVTREEHRAYVEGLLAKEGNKTINEAEKTLYRPTETSTCGILQAGLLFLVGMLLSTASPGPATAILVRCLCALLRNENNLIVDHWFLGPLR